ncbi:MAG: 16S rRNA (adenine(1518)-N(6)/adenine(1519)-N(6))-dimethyltransferase RsmA [Anaerolineae bacterium]
MNVRQVLSRYGIRPSKGLGQNFLTDERVMETIVRAADLHADDIVLEVGPGVGLMTLRMAQQAGQVVAIELDRKMVAVLAQTVGDLGNVHVVQGDILEVDHVALLAEATGLPDPSTLRYQVVANLPYYITSAALRALLGARIRPKQLTVMVQREVAERITASPGQMSLLAISVQVYGQPEIVARVPASAFYPPPKVDSAILHVRVFGQPRVSEAKLPRFFQVVHAGFGQKRKQLHNSLGHGLRLSPDAVNAALQASGVAPDRRAQTLTIEEWAALADALT